MWQENQRLVPSHHLQLLPPEGRKLLHVTAWVHGSWNQPGVGCTVIWVTNIANKSVHYGHRELWRPPPSNKMWFSTTIQAKEEGLPHDLVIFLPREFVYFWPQRELVSPLSPSIEWPCICVCWVGLYLLANTPTLSICPGALAIGGFYKSNK